MTELLAFFLPSKIIGPQNICSSHKNSSHKNTVELCEAFKLQDALPTLFPMYSLKTRKLANFLKYRNVEPRI